MPGQEHLKTYRTREEAEEAAQILREGGIEATILDQREADLQELDLDRGFHLMVEDVRWNAARDLLRKAPTPDAKASRTLRWTLLLVVGILIVGELAAYLVPTLAPLGGIGWAIALLIFLAYVGVEFWGGLGSRRRTWWGWHRHSEEDDEPV